MNPVFFEKVNIQFQYDSSYLYHNIYIFSESNNFKLQDSNINIELPVNIFEYFNYSMIYQMSCLELYQTQINYQLESRFIQQLNLIAKQVVKGIILNSNVYIQANISQRTQIFDFNYISELNKQNSFINGKYLGEYDQYQIYLYLPIDYIITQTVLLQQQDEQKDIYITNQYYLNQKLKDVNNTNIKIILDQYEQTEEQMNFIQDNIFINIKIEINVKQVNKFYLFSCINDQQHMIIKHININYNQSGQQPYLIKNAGLQQLKVQSAQLFRCQLFEQDIQAQNITLMYVSIFSLNHTNNNETKITMFYSNQNKDQSINLIDTQIQALIYLNENQQYQFLDLQNIKNAMFVNSTLELYIQLNNNTDITIMNNIYDSNVILNGMKFYIQIYKEIRQIKQEVEYIYKQNNKSTIIQQYNMQYFPQQDLDDTIQNATLQIFKNVNITKEFMNNSNILLQYKAVQMSSFKISIFKDSISNSINQNSTIYIRKSLYAVETIIENAVFEDSDPLVQSTTGFEYNLVRYVNYKQKQQYEQNNDIAYIQDYNSPLGKLIMFSDGKHLTGLWNKESKYFGELMNQNQQYKQLEIFDQTKQWLDEYFQGKQPQMNLQLKPIGNQFRQLVWKYLQQIPYGYVTSYGQIANKVAHDLGKQRMSAQAIGNAIKHNPIMIIIPCHRVIGKNRQMVGYAGGIDIKEKLLQLEQSNLQEYFNFNE